MNESLELLNKSYVLYDRVMNPLTSQQERNTRKDRGTRRGRHSTSSSSTFDQPSSSYLNDDDDDGNGEGSLRASTPSPIRYCMSTHSTSNNLVSPLSDPESIIRYRRRNFSDPSLLVDFEEIDMNPNNIQGPPPVGPIHQNHGPPGPNLQDLAPDLRTIEELCQPTMNGRGRQIAPVNVQATDFGLKNHMIQQVQNSCQFHGLPGDDANKHLDKFLTITQSIKQNKVSDDALRLYLFPYSLTHHATAWFDRLPKISIHTFQEMASKFHSKYFPPSMVTKLRNDISNFRQLDKCGYIKNHKKTIKNGQTWTREMEEHKRAKDSNPKSKKVNFSQLWVNFSQLWVNFSQSIKRQTLNVSFQSL
ncbi:reverse transcriptase domain-containing protein [Tanacetum coccineum]